MRSPMTNDLYRKGRTRTFKQIFPQENFYDIDSEEEVTNETNFRWYYEHCGLPCKIGDTRTVPATDTIKTLYILLLGRYGESNISSSNESRFRLELMSKIFQYAPLWERQMQLQDEVRALSFEDLLNGAKVVNGHAYNPSKEIDVNKLIEDSSVAGDGKGMLPVNDANITIQRKDPTSVYSSLLFLLDKDHTTEFLNKFQDLFNPFPFEQPLIYWNQEDDDEE